MKVFQLHRDVDVSGVSGTGVVADGVEWPDGTCTIRWRGQRQSTVNWNSLDDVIAIHGHGGATRIVTFMVMDLDKSAPVAMRVPKHGVSLSALANPEQDV